MPIGPLAPYAPAPLPVPETGTRNREALGRACAEMEALFLNQLMAAMGRTVPSEDAGFARETWTSLRDAEFSRILAAERGIGLRELLMRQLAPDPTPPAEET
jgi:Rod binding domain-containing protein